MLQPMYCFAVSPLTLGQPPKHVLLNRRTIVVSSSAGNDEGKKVLVLGGTGRVGQSICRELKRQADASGCTVNICIAGRNEAKANEILSAHDYLEFKKVDTQDRDSLLAAFEGFDLVLHTAGPFQQKARPEVLEAAIESGVDYQDVCDDVSHMKMSKALNEKAGKANITAAVCTGIYPGISNLMALKAIHALPSDVEEVLFDYFTAGTGGAGPTILSTTFLLCGEDVTTFKGGRPQTERPASDPQTVDFGPGIGMRSTFLLNLPEVHSVAEAYGVKNVRARFGTAPHIWNVLTRFMAYAVPRDLLTNLEFIAKFSAFIGPLVRVVDKIVGGTTGMRVEARDENGVSSTLLYGHNDLSECVGIAGAAFTWYLLTTPELPKGVLCPEELLADPSKCAEVLEPGVRNAFTWQQY